MEEVDGGTTKNQASFSSLLMPAGSDANKYGRVCQNYTVIMQENGARMREVVRWLQVGDLAIAGSHRFFFFQGPMYIDFTHYFEAFLLTGCSPSSTKSF